MTSLYQEIQPVQILTTPFNISNFQFNTFECNVGSNIINLPSFVAIGNSFTINNIDTTAKTIMNGTNTFATLAPAQSIIIFGDQVTNSWVISSVNNDFSPYNIIGTTGNTAFIPNTPATGTITLNEPLINVDGNYYFKVGAILYTSNYSVGISTITSFTGTSSNIKPELYLFNTTSVFQFVFNIIDSTHIGYLTSNPGTGVGANTGYLINIYQI